MLRIFSRCLTVLVVGLTLGNFSPELSAADPLVFISAFAPGENGAIHAYRLELTSGALQPLQRTNDMENPFFMALSPRAEYLYAIHAPGKFGGPESEFVSAYAIVGQSGKLKLLNRQSTLGAASCYLDVDATGKSVLAANYLTGSVAALPVRRDGSLGPAASFMQHAGSSVNPQRQEGPHAHCIVVSPDNRFVFSADLGLDKVLGYRLDPAAAKLTGNRQSFVRTAPGAGPRHLTFHPNGRYVYVINELANSITLFDYQADSGILLERQSIATLPADFSGVSHCADLKITPDGRFLYGTNRGHDSIAAYRISDDGRLTLLAIEPSLGQGPQNLAITSGGELLLCANLPSNNVVVFRINSKTGGLSAVGQPTTLPSPSCIMIRP